MPPRNVVPKPRQTPHPPVWVACSRRETIHLAAQHGIGALAFAFVDPEEASHWVDDYYDDARQREASRSATRSTRTSPCVTTFMCHADEDEAMRRGLEGANFFGYSLAHYYVFGRHRPGRDRRVGRVPGAARPSTATTPRPWQPPRAHGERLGAKVVEDGVGGLRGAIGTPDQLREYLRRYEECGVDQVIFCCQAGQEPPRAHHGEPRAVRDARCCPSSPSATTRQSAREGAAARAGHRGGHGPQARVGSSAAAERRLRRSRRSRATIADRTGLDDFHTLLDDFADRAAAGGADELQGLLEQDLG